MDESYATHETFLKLLLRHEPGIRAFIRAVVHRADDVDEIMQEVSVVASRFDEAVQLAEGAFIEELQNLVSHLTERLSGQSDGKPKVFRDSAVENLTQFFERFRELNVRSNEQLDELVNHCQHVVAGIEPQSLRDNNVLRQSMASELSQVQHVLDELIVDRPRRNILRRSR